MNVIEIPVKPDETISVGQIEGNNDTNQFDKHIDAKAIMQLAR